MMQISGLIFSNGPDISPMGAQCRGVMFSVRGLRKLFTGLLSGKIENPKNHFSAKYTMHRQELHLPMRLTVAANGKL